MEQDINVLALVKGDERYIFLYDDRNRASTLRTLGRYAADPELSFTWYDAAVLSQKIGRTRSVAQQRHRVALICHCRAITVLAKSLHKLA